MSRLAVGIWVAHSCVLAVAGAADLYSDQTAAQGVQFTHHAADPDDLNILGAGAAWGDYDGDGDMDLYVADQLGPNRLFKNQGGGSGFTDVAAAYGVDDPAGWGNGAVWGDYDNDGDCDLYILNRGNNVMFRNDGADGSGGWIFTDVTAEIGVAGDPEQRTSAAVYGDYDNDGWLDLYVVNHSYFFHNPLPGEPGHEDHLYHNVEGTDGQRVFEDVAESYFGLGVLELTVGHSAGFLDYDNDGDLDIYVLSEQFVSDPNLIGTKLWRNDGPDISDGWLFTDATSGSGAQFFTCPMGLAIGDYNNDGWLDMALSDNGANHLLKNLGGSFEDVAEQAGVDRPLTPKGQSQFGWGVVFTDYDLDGYEDLYVATGLMNPNNEQPNPLFHNDGNPPNNTFTEVTDISGCADPGRTRTVVKADYDGDGDEDLYTVTWGGDAILCRNDQEGGNYLILQLVGTVSNHDAIGARVTLTAAGLPVQYRMVQSGSTTGGSNELALFFGVTGASIVDEVIIDWPAGTQTTLTNLAVNQRVTVYEIRTPNGLFIEGPALLEANESASYLAWQTYDNGDPDDVTAQANWSVILGDEFATFDGPGQLSTLEMDPGGSELIQIQATLDASQAVFSATVQETVVDVEAPSVSITGPTGETTLTTGESNVTLSGFAEDNFALAALSWSNDRGGSGPCSGLDDWSTGPIALTDGVNVITVTAIDRADNRASKSIAVERLIPPPEIDDTPTPPDDDEVPLDDEPTPPDDEPTPPDDDPMDPMPDVPDSEPIDDSGENPGDAQETTPGDDPMQEDGAADPEPDDAGNVPVTPSPTGVCGAMALINLPLILAGLCALRRRAT
ncbi:MAG: CRTAC1 family protein [Planctomycetes bacterium]|nr:CRTAC1 family protein [Planctomycetota bacterium]